MTKVKIIVSIRAKFWVRKTQREIALKNVTFYLEICEKTVKDWKIKSDV